MSRTEWNGATSIGREVEGAEGLAAPREMRVLVQAAVDVVMARSKARGFAKALGLKSGEATIVATLMSELARHILRDDGRGEIIVTAMDHGTSRGMIVKMCHERHSAIDQTAIPVRDPLDVDALGGWPALTGPGWQIHELELFWDGVSGLSVTVTRWSLQVRTGALQRQTR